LFSKALRDCAKAYDVGSLDAMGLDRDVIFKQVQNSCLRLARNNAQTQCSMLDNFKIDYLQGEATLDLGRFNGRPSTDTAKLVVRPTETPSETIDILANKVLLSLVRVGVRVRHAHNLGRCDARRSPPGSRWSSLASVCASLRARAREREGESSPLCVHPCKRERERASRPRLPIRCCSARARSRSTRRVSPSTAGSCTTRTRSMASTTCLSRSSWRGAHPSPYHSLEP
jgi:hypothetical protein